MRKTEVSKTRALQKLQDMSDSEFAELELYPDFDE